MKLFPCSGSDGGIPEMIFLIGAAFAVGALYYGIGQGHADSLIEWVEMFAGLFGGAGLAALGLWLGQEPCSGGGSGGS